MSPILGIVASANYPRSTNSYESIATLNGTGSLATLTFTSIPSTYQHLQIRASVLTSVGGAGMSFNLNSDSGANYTRHNIIGDGVSAQVGGATSQTYAQFFGIVRGTSTTNPTVFIMDILDYASTSKYKTVKTFLGTDANAGFTGEISLYSNLWMSTSAVNSISINCGQNFTTNTKFSLYGIKG
jgi:hypothetical protein